MSKFKTVALSVQAALKLHGATSTPAAAEAPAAEEPAAPAQVELPAEPQKMWMYSHTIMLKNMESDAKFERFIGERHLLLDKGKYSTIVQAVDGINALDEVTKYVDQVGYGVIWSAIKQRYVMLYKEGPDGDPHKYKYDGMKVMIM